MGSLIATWICQHSPASLTLLGRSGRAARDSNLTAKSFGIASVTLMRSDVAASEEANLAVQHAAQSSSSPLQVLSWIFHALLVN